MSFEFADGLLRVAIASRNLSRASREEAEVAIGSPKRWALREDPPLWFFDPSLVTFGSVGTVPCVAFFVRRFFRAGFGRSWAVFRESAPRPMRSRPVLSKNR